MTDDAVLLNGTVHAVIPFRLSFAIHPSEVYTRARIEDNRALYYFTTRHHHWLNGTSSHSGSVDLSSVAQFCVETRRRLEDPRIAHRHLVYYCQAKKRLLKNSAILLGAYLVLVEGWEPEQAAQRFDALWSALECSSGLRLVDHLRGVQRAQESGFFSLESFDLHEFEFLRLHGMHFVCPKLAALHNPKGSVGKFVQLFASFEVSAVVRLNVADAYDQEEIERAGIRHFDLFFEDGTAPPLRIVQRFLRICKQHETVAVHCLAGLGRTGTLIAAWLMHERGWSAEEAVAWVRLVRPGSVNDVQFRFLRRYTHLVRNYCAHIPAPSGEREAGDDTTSMPCCVKRRERVEGSEGVPAEPERG